MTTPPSRPRLLLLGWDAADWNLIHPFIAEGDMPALAGLMERGVWGNLASLQPMVSPMLWTTIATGHTADRHGVLGFTEPNENGEGLRPWSSLTRRSKALWNILMQHGWHTSTVGWWASHPAEPLSGVVVANTIMDTSAGPGGALTAPPGCIHPAEKVKAFTNCCMLAQEVTKEHILPFVPRAIEVDQDKDRRLSNIAELLSCCVTIQSAATRIMEGEPWEFLAVYFDGIDHFGHSFMPWHPPQMAHISDADFHLYKDVVRGAYKFHDMMLERLLQLAGPETNIILCSDHGFLSGPHRPLANPNDPAGPTLWHRDMGVLVMAGPDVQRGARIYGASLLDIAPTVLALAGLPAGKDMPGRVLEDVLTSDWPRERIPTWEEVTGNDGRPPPGTEYGAVSAESSLTKQLVALGYIEDPAGDQRAVAEAARMEADFNLAQVHLAKDEPDAAIPLLEALLHARPWESRYIHQLANACVRAGYHTQAVELLRRAYPENAAPPPAAVFLLMTRACLGMGERATAAWYCRRAAQQLPVLSGACVELANLWLELDEYLAAEHACRRALTLDPTLASAHETLSGVHLRLGRPAEAAESALAAIELIQQSAGAHLNLGIALARMGRYAEAHAAFRNVTVMRPRHPLAWRYLAALPEDGSSSAFLREACRQQSRRLSREWVDHRRDERSRARSLRPLPEIPPPHHRKARTDAERPPQDNSRRAPLGLVFTLVSGLPRSGTSLMMQMLEAGGLPPLTDRVRSADDDNPAGYYEWEPIKSIARQPALLDEPAYERRALKCITALLSQLPSRHRYRVLFMVRPIEEIVRSQQRMMERRGTTASAGGTPEEMSGVLQKHRDETLAFLAARPQYFDVLLIDYPSLVADPALWIEKIAAFLGPELLPHSEHMAAAVQPALHRNRA